MKILTVSEFVGPLFFGAACGRNLMPGDRLHSVTGLSGGLHIVIKYRHQPHFALQCIFGHPELVMITIRIVVRLIEMEDYYDVYRYRMKSLMRTLPLHSSIAPQNIVPIARN